VTLTAVPGIRVGHGEVPGGGSGCTAILGPFRGALEILGMATGSRELHVLSPRHLAERVDALLLTGGSAFGLGAADGVMAWLEERGLGFDTGLARVPLVPAAVLFDLATGVGRPGPQEGRRACESAVVDPVPEGRVGAGAGATVGKLHGMEGAAPGGVGSASGSLETRGLGRGVVGALAVVNALGAVFGEDGRVLAGEGGVWTGARGSPGPWGRGGGDGDPKAGGFPAGANTTMTVVATDLPLSRVELGKVAGMAAAALARTIAPVGTPFDGDMVFAVSTSQEAVDATPGDVLAVGVLARELLEESIRRAVSAEARVSSRAPREGP
jgi:L-aminopeptidase/D-esterase-like protein